MGSDPGGTTIIPHLFGEIVCFECGCIKSIEQAKKDRIKGKYYKCLNHGDRLAFIIKHCVVCKKAFISIKPNVSYCSEQCRTIAVKKKEKDTIEKDCPPRKTDCKFYDLICMRDAVKKNIIFSCENCKRYQKKEKNHDQDVQY